MSKEEERIFVDFEPNDFIIRISPITDDTDTWTGEINVGYLSLDENFLSEEDYEHLDMVANCAVSSIPFMEDNVEFRKKLYKYTVDMLKEEQKPAVTEEDGNVVKLRFS